MKIDDYIDFDTRTYKWDAIEKVPEFAKLKECKQNPKWHKEGTAWEHTKRVCDSVLELFPDIGDAELKLLMAAALFHDIGKGTTTFFKEKDQQWHAYGHEIESEKITRQLLADENDHGFANAVCNLVRWHMTPLDIRKSNHKVQKIIELARVINPVWFHNGYSSNFDLLIKLKQCDVAGSEQEDKESKASDLEWLNKLSIAVADLSLLFYFPASLLDI